MKKKNMADLFGSNPWGIKSQIFDVQYNSKVVIGIDVGGTKTLIAHTTTPDSGVLAKKLYGFGNVSTRHYYANASYSSLTEIIRDHLDKYNLNARETAVCIAGAGPVKNNAIEMTNRSWSIHADDIFNSFQFRQVFLINDLEAMVYAIDGIEPVHMITLNRGKKIEHGNVAVIAAGTGLGESIGVTPPHSDSRFAIATEGGNTAFSPADDFEIELLKYLRAENAHISWEDILSGKGLSRLYEFLLHAGGERNSDTQKDMETKNPAEVISARGLSGEDPVCSRALQIFVSVYASEAGNLALRSLSYGGLYIAGGIAPGLAPLMQDGLFMNRFLNQGKLRSLLETIPVYLVTNPEYGVLGAINFALMNLPLI